MGVVYLARDVALERPVAIKVLAPALAARGDMRERFLREARIAAQCFHPHIVPIHAVEEADDLAWIVMAYVRGETLADRLRRTGPLDADEVRRLGREVGWALSYAHQRGVVHRDIKPENLLIDASTGRYLIADFGIAQATNQSVTPVGGTATGTATGTARYMAPEQALGEATDGRADLYALGVTLFVAATGRAPFDGQTAMALVAQHAAQPAPSVRAHAPALPLTLVRAIDRCLAKRPEERPDASQFLALIEADVRQAPLAAAVRAARDHANASRTMLGWSLVLTLTGTMLVLGEPSGSFGRAILIPIGSSVVTLFAAATLLRGGEALLEARRLLRLGQSPAEVSRALAGDDTSDSSTSGVFRTRGGGAALLAVGMALAYAQGGLSASSWLPDMLQSVGEAITLFVPPMLIARGAGSLLRTTGMRRWLHERVMTPLAEFATRRLAKGKSNPSRQAPLADAPTEVLLVRAVESAVAALPAAHRESMGDVDAIARSLADRIASLRADARQFDAREAEALVCRDATLRSEQLESVRVAREAVGARLQSTMAALESLRLDILQLALDRSDSGFTTQLEQVRDVQRRVDAAMDVRRFLHAETPT